MIFKLLLENHLLILEALLKAVPESMFRLTYFAERTWAGFRKPLVYRFSESSFRKPFLKTTGGFQLAEHDC